MMKAALAVFVAAFFVMMIGLSASAPARAARLSVEISIVQIEADTWRIDYALSHPVKTLDLGPSLGGFRAKSLKIKSRGVWLKSQEGRDFLTTRGRGFQSVSMVLRANGADVAGGPVKDYAPLRALGPAGAVFYTGHFWPRHQAGGRLPAQFSFTPREGEGVIAFGRGARQVDDWQSPYQHPAFVYFGPARADFAGGAYLLIDPETPAWLADLLRDEGARVVEQLALVFARRLEEPPIFFLDFEDGPGDGVLSFRGDALPGQLLMAAHGDGWREQTELGRTLWRRGFVHEAVHLWQTDASPFDPRRYGWIHEGAADAIAAELMVEMGFWTPAERAADFRDAKTECAEHLRDGSLAGAEARGAVRALYACGHVLSRLAAAPMGSVAEFWRLFAARADAQGGYDDQLFFDLVAETAGADAGDEMRRFVRTPFARPDKALARLVGRFPLDVR